MLGVRIETAKSKPSLTPIIAPHTWFVLHYLIKYVQKLTFPKPAWVSSLKDALEE